MQFQVSKPGCSCVSRCYVYSYMHNTWESQSHQICIVGVGLGLKTSSEL